MNKLAFTFLLFLGISTLNAEPQTTGIYDISVTKIDGTKESMANYNGKVLLIVNTASECGFTKQYKGLEELHQNFSNQGLVVMGFPCNQFGGQEPGTAAEIQKFCEVKFGVEFPMFQKVNVNGDDAHPLFKYIKAEAPGVLGTESIKWNFTKFLVDQNGKVVERFGSRTTPAEIGKKIKTLLAKSN
jgi:glutathione peroxidase